MAPPASTQTLLSPAELSFIHSSLSLQPPIRPDLRTPTQFRPLVAETDIFPNTNGSARICFSDGTEAIVGVKAEVEKTTRSLQSLQTTQERAGSTVKTHRPTRASKTGGVDGRKGDSAHRPGLSQDQEEASPGPISDSWLECSIEIPGFRDDDNLPVFLGSMISETLLAEGTLKGKLYINPRWHWKLYIDVLLLSPPLSYPLPLLSLTTHLALLDARLPRLISDPEDDPLFDDDWEAAVPLYSREASQARPPVSLLVMTVAENIIFDPSKEELAVADAVLAISIIPYADGVKLLAIRTIDPPSRLTPPGIPNSINPAIADGTITDTSSKPKAGNVSGPTNVTQELLADKERENIWTPPRGGIKRSTIARIVKMVVGKGGVGEEVVEGLAGVKT